jgi:hypothetical protein
VPQAYSYHAFSTYHRIDWEKYYVQGSSRTLALLPAKENLRFFKDLLLEILEEWLQHGIS